MLRAHLSDPVRSVEPCELSHSATATTDTTLYALASIGRQRERVSVADPDARFERIGVRDSLAAVATLAESVEKTSPGPKRPGARYRFPSRGGALDRLWWSLMKYKN